MTDLLRAISLLLLSFSAFAQSLVTEVIPIGYRDAQELIPILRPLVPRPGSVSGLYNQLVVRTTPNNLAEIKRVVAELDRRPRNLLVTVRQSSRDELEREEAELSARIRHGDLSVRTGPAYPRSGGVIIGGNTGDSRVNLRLSQGSSLQQGRDLQQVRVLEGGQAFVDVGVSVPLLERDIVLSHGDVRVRDRLRYQDVGTGFYATPRLNGERVTLEISPYRSRFGANGVDNQAVSTAVTGRLGEWLELADSKQRDDRRSSGIASYDREQSSRGRSVFVKVELLDD